MPTSNQKFNAYTTGHEIVSAYPDQVKGKIVLITGANPGGVGGSSAISLAKASPKLLIVAGRSHAKLDETTKNVKDANADVVVKKLILDLSSQDSCRRAAEEILADPAVPQIDILVNNAGVMNIEERTLSPEGIEMQFATNHVGHFLFTNLIVPKLVAASEKATPGSTRIINLSSRAVLYAPVRFSDWNFTKKEANVPQSEHMSTAVRQQWNQTEDKPYIPQAAYGQSKSANVLYTLELNKRLFKKSGILSVAVHPGAVSTELARHMDQEELKKAFDNLAKNSPSFLLKDLDQGCSTTLVAALDPNLKVEDLFMADCQVADWAPEYSTSPEKAAQLWNLSEGLVREQFSL